MSRCVPLASVALAVALAGVALPQVGRANDVAPQAAAGVPAVGPPRVLVMHDGKLIEGEILPNPTGYQVVGVAGSVFVPATAVWFSAGGRREVYDEMKQRLAGATAAGHVGLARWCLDYQLYGPAEEELAVALRLEPDNAAARATLRRLHGLLDPRAAATESADRNTRAAFLPSADAPTLAGLPPEAAAAFVTTVQPILVSRCGNTACHGQSADGAFRLNNVRNGSAGHRRLTEENLTAIAALLRRDRPRDSPLLAVPAHPGHARGRAVYAGPTQERQRQAVEDWVRIAAPVLAPAAAPEPEAPLRPVSFAEPAPPADEPAPPDVAPEETGSDTAASVAADPAAALLRRVLHEERPDAFDPDEFNRRFGPPAAVLPESRP